jgi:hypothetical protein
MWPKPYSIRTGDITAIGLAATSGGITAQQWTDSFHSNLAHSIMAEVNPAPRECANCKMIAKSSGVEAVT